MRPDEPLDLLVFVGSLSRRDFVQPVEQQHGAFFAQEFIQNRAEFAQRRFEEVKQRLAFVRPVTELDEQRDRRGGIGQRGFVQRFGNG